MLLFGTESCIASKALNRRIERQGKERTHTIPKHYKGRTDWVLKSPTPVIWMSDVDMQKLNAKVVHSTVSGIYFYVLPTSSESSGNLQ